MPKDDDPEAVMRKRLEALKLDLGAAIAEEQVVEAKTEGKSAKDGGALAAGLKASTELVAGVLVGGFIGYMLDQWLGTKPWLMMVFLIFGIAAGFRNLYRLGMKPTHVDGRQGNKG